MKKYAAFLLIVVPFVFSCKGQKPDGNIVSLFVKGEVMVKEGTGPEAQLEIKKVLENGSTLRSGPASFAVLQVSDYGILRIAENTTVSISILRKGLDKNVKLQRGVVVSKIKKLLKGEEVTVDTSTVTASIRGTRYMVSHMNSISTVAVSTGKVHVVYKKKTIPGKDDPVEESLSEKETVIVGEKILRRKIIELEELEIQKADLYSIDTGVMERKPGDMKKTGEEKEPELKQIEERIKELRKRQHVPLKELKALFGRIDVVTTYRNRTIKGVIIERKTNFKIMTSRGIIYIPAKQVKTSAVLR